ncbi:hypothetical protein GCM10018790_74090 [Kitasatospora xanthocidica]|uniref:DUF6215 domain-containing protein n=1 Tax=Kitasatospora xanthocidica TaxID=83382 RepID=UPI00167738D1|nr:DUF6215 domain-containing protein [Kitasatospora xanthocidica]GHF85778.1 hypothetical protein GCM10018790_74090 [Kitasatospora xanthocidica]
MDADTTDTTDGTNAAEHTEDTEDTGKSGPRTGLQLLAAVGLVGAVVAGLWGVSLLEASTKPAEKPAECTAPRPTDPPGYPALCAAVNRPDLPTLLGTPEDRVTTAHPAPLALGKDPMVEVRLMHTVVGFTDSSTTVEDMIGMPQFRAVPATVLGHPAVTYSSNAFVLAPGANTGPVTRNLVVAQDPKAPAGRAFEISVFREDGRALDDATLNRLAETVLPTLPGWVAAP